MKKVLVLTLTLAMVMSLALSGCSVERVDESGDYSHTAGDGSAPSGSDAQPSGDRVVNVCSWGEYLHHRQL